MIYKSIIVSTLLFILWSIIITIKPLSLSQHQWQRNLVKAEKYLFDYDNPEKVIVGSSLASRIPKDSIDNICNLSFGGQSIFDGLNLLRLKEKLPKVVFIEINMLDKSENVRFNKIISSQISIVLKSNFKALRSDKQPLAVLSETVNKTYLAIGINKKKKNLGNTSTEEKLSTNPLFNRMLLRKKKNYSKAIQVEKYNIQFDILAEHVKFLESKNTEVIFFEMPVNFELVNLDKATYLRARIENEFPKNSFIKLPPNVNFYKTADGFHLTKDEAQEYSTYFREELKRIKIQ